jgi:indole-3-glycerol phosphate synthase
MAATGSGGVAVPNILDEILAHKRAEVERAAAAVPVEGLRSQEGYVLPRRNFFGAVSVPRRRGPNLIAEIKRASPSAGLIRGEFDPVELARQYAVGGADAISVLTDEKFFQGRLEYIEQVKAAVGLPVLRKDFLICEYQLYESRAAGADAVLLIAEALEADRLPELVCLAQELELCVLLEVHTSQALHQCLMRLDQARRQNLLIGINNRDLKTQTIDLETSVRLAGLVPPGLPIVAESGVATRRDVERLHAAGARALLVGEALLRQEDAAQAIRRLFG